MADAPETGIRWWVRYAIVPLIGGAGIIGVWIAYIGKPVPEPKVNVPAVTTPAPSPYLSPSSPAKPVEEKPPVIQAPEVDPRKTSPFYVSTDSLKFADHDIYLTKTEQVTIHWNFPDEDKPLVLEIYGPTGNGATRQVHKAGSERIEISSGSVSFGILEDVPQSQPGKVYLAEIKVFALGDDRPFKH